MGEWEGVDGGEVSAGKDKPSGQREKVDVKDEVKT